MGVTFGPGAIFAAAKQLLGVRMDPYAAFHFLVEIEGLIVGGFTEVSGLEVDTDVHEYREGGVNHFVHKLPGPTSHPSSLVLRQGLTDIDALWQWYHDVTQGIIKRRHGTIYLLNRHRIPAVWWNFKDALPVKWSGPSLRADANEIAVEAVELVHRGIERHGLARAAIDGIGSLF